jgi:steroid 5-alpha reductase family enzyme
MPLLSTLMRSGEEDKSGAQLISPSLFLSLTLSLAAVFLFMTLAWVVSARMKNAGIVDICWGPCFVLQVWIYFALTPEGYIGRKILIALLVTVWGLRLSIYIFRRNRGKPEDYRYQAFRQHFGPERCWWVSLWIFLLTPGAHLGYTENSPQSHTARSKP